MAYDIGKEFDLLPWWCHEGPIITHV